MDEPHLPLNPHEHRVVVLGASPKPARYSNQVVRTLKSHGYTVIPVHPKAATIEGIPVTPSLYEIPHPVHTLTLYVGPEHSQKLIDGIVALTPGRVIFNPGTESAELEARLHQAQIPVVHGCTLVMLETGTFG